MGFFGLELASPYGQIIFYIQVVVALFLSAHILLRKQDPYICMGWLLGVALFPLITLIFYMGVGVNPFPRYADRKRHSKALAMRQRMRREGSDTSTLGEASLNKSGGISPFFQRTFQWATRVTGRPVKVGNSVELIVNSDLVYAAMSKSIEQAKSYIVVQFYQIQADDIGFAFLDLLARKAQEGISVHVLFDALGSFSLKTAIVRKYQARGVRMRRFLEIHPFKRRFQINWRNHRKLIIVDGNEAYVGGFNIGRLYLQGPDLQRPSWVDLIFKMRGPVIKDFLEQFIEDWHFTSGQSLPHLEDALAMPSESAPNSSLLVPVLSGPTETVAPFYSTVQQILFEAKRRVWIMTPYFVPDKALLHAMRLAVIRGVHVRVVVPMHSNHQFTDLCASSYFAELKSFGIDLVRYKYGVCHGKVILADEDVVFAGSSNMDYRSFFLNFETDILVQDKELALQIEEFFCGVVQNSAGLTDADINPSPIGRLIVRRLMRLFAPLM